MNKNSNSLRSRDSGVGKRRRSVRCDGGETAKESSGDPCRIQIQNLGGINEAELSIPSGISILVGRNATNRSSLLRSLAAVLGGHRSAARLKTDAESGSVRLWVSEEEYTRAYSTPEGTVTGTPYVENSDLIDTFVALFADCPARRAVEQGDDLREVLMKPVDTSEIRARIVELKRDRDRLDETIREAEDRKRELPELEEDRSRYEDELAAIEEEITKLESVVADIEATATESNETAELRSELETLRGELRSDEQRIDEIEQQLEFRNEEQEKLIEQREKLTANLIEEDEAETLQAEITALEQDIDRLSEKRATLERAVEDIQSVIQANESFLNGEIGAIGLTDDESVAAALDPSSQTIECWTCGTEVEQSDISERIETLRGIATQQRNQMNEIETELAELKRQKSDQESKLAEYREKAQRLEELDERIEKHGTTIEELEADREQRQAEVVELQDKIDAVEKEITDVKAGETEDASEFINAHQELTKLERERGRVENKLQNTVEAIEEIESLTEAQTEAKREREEITDELESLRGRIDELETELVETLNGIMDDLVDRLEYDNIERVWLERQISEGSTESVFELHIVREGTDGTVYEDTAATLSESEREVIGLVISLAGYLVHEVDRTVPFLLLDSVEMIDGRRLAELLDYMQTETQVEYLSVALLPKDAQSVRESGVFDEYSTIDFESVSI